MLYVKDGSETQAIDLMIEIVRYGKENIKQNRMPGNLEKRI